MKNILITGATGNIGQEVIRSLFALNTASTIIAGVRNIDKAKKLFTPYSKLNYVTFDFEMPETFSHALKNIDCVYLLRPPHISNVNKYFAPLIHKIKESACKSIVFLSVMGAEKSSVIPHNKIEKLVVLSGVPYIFLRPSYFMQNCTTTLLNDIITKKKIILPAGSAKFNWIDAKDIGEVSAILMSKFSEYANRAIELTGTENENFETIASIINDYVVQKITYVNCNPIKYFFLKRREGVQSGMIFVMIMLHFIQRFQKEPLISHFYEDITGKKPTTLRQFVMREKEVFDSLPS